MAFVLPGPRCAKSLDRPPPARAPLLDGGPARRQPVQPPKCSGEARYGPRQVAGPVARRPDRQPRFTPMPGPLVEASVIETGRDRCNVAEELFEEIGAVDLEIESFEGAEAQGLALGEIPRVLQPDEPCLVQQCFVGRPLLADLVPADLVDGRHEMAHDVELVEYQHRLGRARGLAGRLKCAPARPLPEHPDRPTGYPGRRPRPRLHATIAVPGATTESIGLPDNSEAGGAWIMEPGTSAAHIMIPGR